MSTFLALFCAVPLVIIALLWRTIKFLKWKSIIDSIGGPPDLPIIGNAHQLKTDTADFFRQMFDFATEFNRNKAFRLWMGPKPMVFVFGSDIYEALMGSNKLITKAREYKFIRPWLNDGLLTSTGQKWKSRRRLLTPSFHFKILEDFTDVFNEQSRILVAKLSKMSNGPTFDIWPFINLCSLDIICESAMGCHLDTQSACNKDYVKAIAELGDVITQRWRMPWKQPDALFRWFDDYRKQEEALKTLTGFTRKVIKERQAALNNEIISGKHVGSVEEKEQDVLGRRKRMAFLDMLLSSTEDGAPLSLEAIQEETDTFMFEGHDTVTAATCFAIHCIGRNPDVQKKLLKEMDDIFGSSERSVTTPDLSKMKYLECTIKESLRLFPSVAMIGRTMTEDAQLGNIFVPCGTTVTMFISALHRNPDYYPDPLNFDPDRFRLENVTNRSPYAFVPFAAGPRNCIGQNFAMREEKIMLSHILRKFSIESAQTEEEMAITPDLIIKPKRGLLVKLSRR